MVISVGDSKSGGGDIICGGYQLVVIVAAGSIR